MELDYRAIGKRIKIARIQANLKQEKLAECNTVSFVIEFFRIQGIKIMQFRIFQNFRMKISNAVDTV